MNEVSKVLLLLAERDLPMPVKIFPPSENDGGDEFPKVVMFCGTFKLLDKTEPEFWGGSILITSQNDELLRLKVSNFIASLQEYRNDMVAKGAYDFSVPPSENVGR